MFGAVDAAGTPSSAAGSAGGSSGAIAQGKPGQAEGRGTPGGLDRFQAQITETLDTLEDMRTGQLSLWIDPVTGIVEVYEVIEAGGGAGAARAIARALRGAPKVLRASSLHELLAPGGKLIGRRGTGAGIRRLTGTAFDAQQFFANIIRTRGGGRLLVDPTYKGIMVELKGGGSVGLRIEATKSASRSTAATIDVNVPGSAVKKLKFEP